MAKGSGNVKLRDIFLAFWEQAKFHPWLAAGNLLGRTIDQVTGVITPLYLAYFINDLAHAGVPTVEEVTKLKGTLFIIAGLFAVQWCGRRLAGFSIVRFEVNVMRSLFSSAFGYLLRHSAEFFNNQFAGTLTRRVSKYVFSFEALWDSFSGVFYPSLLYITGSVIVLTSQNAMLGAILGVWAVLFFALQWYLAHLRQPVRLARSEADSALTGVIADAISNQHAVAAFAANKREEHRLDTFVERWTNATMRSWTFDELIWALQGAIMFGMQLGMMFVGLYFWQQGLVQVGVFVLVQTYLLTIMESVSQVTRELRRVYDALADASEMVDILVRKHAIADIEGARKLHVTGGSIVFEGVSFEYNDASSAVLHDFNLVIPAHQKVGLVGRSGAGKTTIMKLLLRNHDVTKGDIFIDNQSVSMVTQDSLRASLGLVPQEAVLFHRTLEENIAYGKPNARKRDIVAASKKAHANDFIERLPKKYETLVGERGVKLSGGERQRVAIARAILKDAPILLLDEATSALDSESEVKIQEALHELMQGKTVIAIAHRLSTLREMDRIIVMDKGRIVEDGSHEELVAKGGTYAELWNHQAGGFVKDE